jgi:hypothetical protein
MRPNDRKQMRVWLLTAPAEYPPQEDPPKIPAVTAQKTGSVRPRSPMSRPGTGDQIGGIVRPILPVSGRVP